MNSASLPAPVLILVDGNNAAYSVAQYDPRDPSKRHSCLLSILRGMSRMLGMDGLTAPGRVVAVWDSGLAPWRKKLFPGYKAQRAADRAKEDPEAMLRRDQRNIDIKAARFSVLPWLGVDQLFCGCGEGDDLILYALDHLAGAGQYKSVLIVSGDGDLDQLLTPRRAPTSPLLDNPAVYRVAPTDLYKAWQSVSLRTGASVVEKYGVWPEDYVGVKAIIGDSSDNIPGVGGCGIGTMVPLLSNCGNKLENFFAQDASAVPTRAKVCFTPDGLIDIARNVSIMTLRWPDEAVGFTPGARCATYAAANKMLGTAEGILCSPPLGLTADQLGGINFGNFLDLIQRGDK